MMLLCMMLWWARVLIEECWIDMRCWHLLWSAGVHVAGLHLWHRWSSRSLHHLVRLMMSCRCETVLSKIENYVVMVVIFYLVTLGGNLDALVADSNHREVLSAAFQSVDLGTFVTRI